MIAQQSIHCILRYELSMQYRDIMKGKWITFCVWRALLNVIFTLIKSYSWRLKWYSQQQQDAFTDTLKLMPLDNDLWGLEQMSPQSTLIRLVPHLWKYTIMSGS